MDTGEPSCAVAKEDPSVPRSVRLGSSAFYSGKILWNAYKRCSVRLPRGRSVESRKLPAINAVRSALGIALMRAALAPEIVAASAAE